MPLPFSSVCDLLDQTYQQCLARKKVDGIIASWFARHRSLIDAHDTDLAALLSTLLPEKRTDRVYCIQERTLEKIIARALGLGSSRVAELISYRRPGQGLDLADCVERLLFATPNPLPLEAAEFTVEHVDSVLHDVASGTRWSSPSVRASQSALTTRNRNDLEDLYRRCCATEAKWLTRLVLKNYQPLTLPNNLLFRLCDPILPNVLKVQDDFSAAIAFVQATRTRLLPNSARTRPSVEQLLSAVKPKLGVKVGRQQWLKARSIKHCLSLGHGRMIVQDKVDGEYCQIHIDASKGHGAVQIFSKSGKDSTEDRNALIQTIADSLALRQADSCIRKSCILEGELVVWSDQKQQILPFHKIRNHVTRRGYSMNTEMDSPPGPDEHLMIIYYEVLFLDDESLLNVRYSDRLKILGDIVHCRTGKAQIVKGQTIDFGSPLGASTLRKAFAQTIVCRSEGLVLKHDEPYFDFLCKDRSGAGRCIKLKKEYVGNFGDVGDFAVVGGGYSATTAKSYQVTNLKWTHFFVGCLQNKEQVCRWGAKPEFMVVNIVELNEGLMRTFVAHCSPDSVDPKDNTTTEVKLPMGLRGGMAMAAAFMNPLVFDLRCFSFDKTGNHGFWSLRFPMVTKIHFDRDYLATVSFEDLQNIAAEAAKAPKLDDSQENLDWIAKLEAADPRGVAVDAVSQQTRTTGPTPSPRQSTQSSRSCRSPTAVESPTPAAQRPQLLQLPVMRPEAFVSRQVQLVTPPTSSPTNAADYVQRPGQRQVKRRSPSSKAQSPVRKRLKNSTTVQTSSSPGRGLDRSQLRRPLGDIDDNSQRSIVSINSSQVSPDKMGSQKSNDLPALSPMSRTEGVEVVSSQTERASSPPHGSTNDARNPKQDSIDAPNYVDLIENPHCQVNTATSPDTPRQDRDENIAKGTCVHAGPSCAFRHERIVVYRPWHEMSETARKAFGVHGITSADDDFKNWLIREGQQAAMEWKKTKPLREEMIFVDTKDESIDMKELLERVDKVYNGRERSREWVEVYDWRVLQSLAVHEDDSITKKYFGGFGDPWRRWFCGLV